MSTADPHRWPGTALMTDALPEVDASRRPHAQYEFLMRACRALPPIRTAVVHPCRQRARLVSCAVVSLYSRHKYVESRIPEQTQQ